MGVNLPVPDPQPWGLLVVKAFLPHRWTGNHSSARRPERQHRCDRPWAFLFLAQNLSHLVGA